MLCARNKWQNIAHYPRPFRLQILVRDNGSPLRASKCCAN
jgi:hypothetical protein